MTETGEYILGVERAEIDRLRVQHKVWVRQAYALFERAGFRAGDVLLDLGSGPGFTTFELARVVGPTGHVLAVDRSPRFLGWLGEEASRQGLAHVETRVAEAESLCHSALPSSKVYSSQSRPRGRAIRTDSTLLRTMAELVL